MRKKVSYLIVCIIAILLVGCSNGEYLPVTKEMEEKAAKIIEEKTAEIQKENAESEESIAVKSLEEEKNFENNGQTQGYTIGILMPNISQTLWSSQAKYMTEKFEADGNNVIVKYASDNLDIQKRQIDELLSEGTDCLIITAVDCVGIADVCDRAKTKGCKIISSDRLICDTDAVDAYVTFDLFETGRLQGEYIAKHLDLSSPKNLEIVSGPTDDTNARYFYEGAMSELKPLIENGQLSVKSRQISFEDTETPRWDSINAQSRMTEILNKYYKNDHLDAVLAAADCVALGTMAALDSTGYYASGKLPPLITGQDAELYQLHNIRYGFASMTEFLDPNNLAEVIVPVTYSLLEDKLLPSNTYYNNGYIDIPGYLYNPKTIDKDNLEYLVDVGFYTHSEIFK